MLKKGDIISKDGEKRKVLEVLGDIVFVSRNNNYLEVSNIYYLKSELQDWKVEGEDWKPKHFNEYYFIR